jgi:hypothetical protein
MPASEVEPGEVKGVVVGGDDGLQHDTRLGRVGKGQIETREKFRRRADGRCPAGVQQHQGVG